MQLPLLQQGGVEVLVRTLLECAAPGDELVLISRDHTADLVASGWAERLHAHLQVPEGILPQKWGAVLANWLIAQQVDLCHFHLTGTYGWAAGRWQGCPIVATASSGIPSVTTNHSATCYFSGSFTNRPYWKNFASVMRKWPGKARQLAAVRWEACVSQHDHAVSQRYFPTFADKLVQVYHSRLDSSAPTPPPSGRTILNVGTVCFHKGQHILAKAFAQIAKDFPDWRLVLAGYHAERACIDVIHSIIRHAGLQERIELPGPVADPTSCFHQSSIYVQPSLLEGLGLSLQEAMFNGLPCIGSNLGGIPELINDPSVGILFEAGNVGELVQSLNRLMSDPPLRVRLGAAARSSIIARGMTRQAMHDTYQKLYQQALNSP